MGTRLAKEVRVILKEIRCSKVGDDDGDTLEIYGHLDALGVFVDAQGIFQPGFTGTLWHHQDNDVVRMAETNQLFPNKSATFLVFENDFLWVGGHLKEDDDFNEDDEMGIRHERILYKNIASTGSGHVSVKFNQSGQAVETKFGIEVLRDNFLVPVP